jgi:hypothetical protein
LPTIVLTQGYAYLNVSYTNTSNGKVTAYVSTVISSNGGAGTHVPGVVVSIGPGGEGKFYITLGRFAPGSYSATFYAVDNGNSGQLSQQQTIQFTLQ